MAITPPMMAVKREPMRSHTAEAIGANRNIIPRPIDRTHAVCRKEKEEVSWACSKLKAGDLRFAFLWLYDYLGAEGGHRRMNWSNKVGDHYVVSLSLSLSLSLHCPAECRWLCWYVSSSCPFSSLSPLPSSSNLIQTGALICIFYQQSFFPDPEKDVIFIYFLSMRVGASESHRKSEPINRKVASRTSVFLFYLLGIYRVTNQGDICTNDNTITRNREKKLAKQSNHNKTRMKKILSTKGSLLSRG